MNEKPLTSNLEDDETIAGCEFYVNDSTLDEVLRIAEGGVA